MGTKCNHCGKPLKESIRINIEDRVYKSCPLCSQENGKYHVFYSFPKEFGTSTKRITANHPEGDQSYCTVCRGGKQIARTDGILCKDLV